VSGETSGAFDVRIGSVKVTGTYRFKFFWQGSMERDNGDYILYQGTGSVSDLEWRETHRDIPTGKISHIPASERSPEYRMTYLLREGDVLTFSAAFSPLVLNTPDHTSYTVWLPRSAENPSSGSPHRYNRDVIEGSNRLDVVEKQIYRDDHIMKDFVWKWRRNGAAGSQRHRVEMRLKISKFEK
jgi:hypothetical protein